MKLSVAVPVMAGLGMLVRSSPARAVSIPFSRWFGTSGLVGGVQLRGGAVDVWNGSSVKAYWRQLSAGTAGDEPIARSSHEISLAGGKVFLFGGEHKARVPIDANLWALEQQRDGPWKWQKMEARGEIPPPRIGHAQAAVGAQLYVMGGRQGISMGEALLDDLFCFDTTTSTWERIEPAPESAPAPSPRSFHRMVSAASVLLRIVCNSLYQCGADGVGKSDSTIRSPRANHCTLRS